MIKKIFCFIFFLPLSAFANEKTSVYDMPAGIYELDPSHSSLHFKIDHMGLSKYTARFTKFKTSLNFNPKNFSECHIETTINPNSVKTDYPFKQKKDFDKKISTHKDLLNSGKFSEIKFVSTEVKKTGNHSGIIKGDLTLLGVTKPIELNVNFNGAYAKKPHSEVPALGFSATTKFKRSDFGMNAYIPSVGDEVDVILELEFHKKTDKS